MKILSMIVLSRPKSLIYKCYALWVFNFRISDLQKMLSFNMFNITRQKWSFIWSLRFIAVHYRPVPSTLAQMTVQFGSRPSTFGRTFHFRATVHLKGRTLSPFWTFHFGRDSTLGYLRFGYLIVFCFKCTDQWHLFYGKVSKKIWLL